MRRTRAMALTLVLTVAAGAVPAASAAWGAAGSSGGPHAGSGRELAGSKYLAGYDQSTGFGKASIRRFVVPELACGDEPSGIELGLGYEPVEGERQYIAGVVVACVDGVASYRADVAVGGVGDTSPDVEPGDVITTELVLDGQRLTATVIDRTDPAGSVSVTADVRSADGVTYGAFPVAGGGVTRLPVPDFGKVKMIKATVADGSTRLNRVGDPGIRTSKRKPAAEPAGGDDNQTFTLRRVLHCCLG